MSKDDILVNSEKLYVKDRGYISSREFEELSNKAVEVKKLIITYIKNIAKKNKEAS